MTDSDRKPDEHQFATVRNPRLRLLIPLVVAIAFLMEQLDATIITTAIPDMARSLGTTPLRMNLAVTTYVLTLAVFIPVSGWFADRFGARRIFVLSLVVFTIGSCLCGVADSFAMLVATRALQGFGGAMMTPVGRLILLRSFPRDQFFTAMIYMSLPALVGPVIGPLLGGVITTYASWRWIFYINIPFGCAGILLALRYVEEIRGDKRVRFDFPGFLMVGAGVALLQYGIENVGRPTIPTPAIIAVLIAAALFLLAFIRYARKVAAPAVDLTLFRLRSFRIGTLAGGLARIGMNGVPYLLPLMLQVGFGMSPVMSGSLTFVTSFGALAIRPISTRLLRTLGFDRLLFWSALLGAAVIAGFALIGPDTPYWVIALYIAFFGLLRSAQFMTSNTLSYAEMPSDKLSRATSLGGVLQQLTVSFGVSLSAMLLGLLTTEGAPLTTARFHEVFLLMAIIPLLALPGFRFLKPEDGMEVSGHRRAAKDG
ncbi:MFS transporter [Hypericibacter terrae]|uniref:MFS transporter n=1 Tax=Hypericibacter terrae TaxID=2602015 RepID=A0A5J6MMA0_9PROT|nr:DHA2 family efflux MFS transporter permease subunit [Hypericibacter terrae]QEX18341.1 MFS transporter [Hypericibacter terrae]